ncbi:hypothetical protein ONS95_004611 [Cadophora gregata]|uniref:uncharacterized protein n=1 Tax=Cadophora gregata TaxID=51156 RepID=UPI0026DBD34C|nr:uncharacterized protein ONS95_004611 [Cadophora gregata]KAK0105020.1 hypothetical protein ONS96_004426 [Cadophora gregata f. sp. sojae]KAK0106107.1 hypothetical protein ONS95_004611 [Cadophora gregata]
MKFSMVAAFAFCTAVASADDLNVPSVISAFYPDETPKIDAKASTSLASALHSVESTWENSNKYTSAIAAIYSAAPTAAQASISKSGYEYDALTTESWYTKDVPKAIQTDVADYRKAINSAAAKIVGTPSTSSSGCMKTGVPMVVGAMGVVGGVWAAM